MRYYLIHNPLAHTMVFTNLANMLNMSFQSILWGSLQVIPNLIAALLIFFIGWLIGAGVGRVVTQVINSMRIDQALRAAGIERFVERAGFTLSAGKFLGKLVEWFFIIVFLVAALDVLGLTAVTTFLSTVVLGYLPQVIVAVLILLVAAVLAGGAESAVTASAKAANIHAASFLGKVARYSIWIFAILTALGELQVATPFVQTLFTGIVIAIALAIGLAFGLGGQQAAARYLDRLQSDLHR